MSGIDRFACITIAVKNQDEALSWFTEKLGFEKRVDMPGPGIRFLSVSPKNQPDLQVILASWFPELVGKNPTAVLHTRTAVRPTRNSKSAESNSLKRRYKNHLASRQSSRISTATVMPYLSRPTRLMWTFRRDCERETQTFRGSRWNC